MGKITKPEIDGMSHRGWKKRRDKRGTQSENPKEKPQNKRVNIAQQWLKTLPFSFLEGDLKGCAFIKATENNNNIINNWEGKEEKP